MLRVKNSACVRWINRLRLCDLESSGLRFVLLELAVFQDKVQDVIPVVLS